MIFVMGQNGAMLLLLAEKDVATLRHGNTLFVDDRQTGGVPFRSVTLSLHATNEEALALVRSAGAYVPQGDEMRSAEPRPAEVRCPGCQGITDRGHLLEERCITRTGSAGSCEPSCHNPEASRLARSPPWSWRESS